MCLSFPDKFLQQAGVLSLFRKLETSQSKRVEANRHLVICAFEDNDDDISPQNKHHLSKSLSNIALLHLFLSLPLVQKLDSMLDKIKANQ